MLLPWMQPITATISHLWQMRSLPQGVGLHCELGLGVEYQLEHLALMMLCEADVAQPCGHCRQCHLVRIGEHPDLTFVRPEGKTQRIGVDQVRALNQFVLCTARFAKYRVVIIESIERFTVAAANALLKLLEEPPPSVYFLVSSCSVARILPTIRSRLQLYSIGRPSVKVTSEWLGQQLDMTPSSPLLHQSLSLAMGRPLAALEYLCIHQQVAPPVLESRIEFEVDLKQLDVLQEYQQFCNRQKESREIFLAQVAALIQKLNFPHACLFFELWLQDQIQVLGHSDSDSRDAIQRIWQAFEALHELRSAFIQTPQLNNTHLGRRLFVQWSLSLA